MSDLLPISEIFGPTLQGEGPYIGRRATFIRFGGCNLSCDWCDTGYTWDSTRFDLRESITARSVQSIVDDISTRDGLVVITGGEPMLYAHRPAFILLLGELKSAGRELHVESNGTIFPPEEVLSKLDVVVLSPKLSNAGSHEERTAAMATAWGDYQNAHEVHLKFVCVDESDVASAAAVARAHEWDRSRVWVMPEGTDSGTIVDRSKRIAEAALQQQLQMTTRLHILAWGDTRGK